MKISRTSVFLGGFYISMLILWITLTFFHYTNNFINLAFVFIYGFIPLIGGIAGLFSSLKWGGFSSVLGKAIIYLSIGLITWSMGEMIWTLYYNLILKIEIPYPSLADASFILSWPFWIAGVYFLAKATGVKYALAKKQSTLKIILIPIIALTISYYLLVIVARQGSVEISGGMIKIFFDLAYPILDVVILTLALLVYGLSLQFLGGRFKWPVLIILFSFLVNYFADFIFSYTTTIETYFNGNIADLLFMTAMFLLSFGVNNFNVTED